LVGWAHVHDTEMALLGVQFSKCARPGLDSADFARETPVYINGAPFECPRFAEALGYLPVHPSHGMSLQDAVMSLSDKSITLPESTLSHVLGLILRAEV